MLLYLLLCYSCLLANFSSGEAYSNASTTEDHAAVTFTEEKVPLTTEAMDYHTEKYEVPDDNHQREFTLSTDENTEESIDTQATSTDFSSTTVEEDATCEVPGPVSNLAVEDISSNSLNISWLAPSNGSNCVKWYVISWSDTSTTIWTNDTTSELNFTIQDLNPCTQYVVSVFAESKVNETSEPRNSTVTTASDVPGVVSDLTIQDVLSDSINITWRPPSYAGNCVKRYSISWSDSSTTVWSHDKTDELHYAVKSMNPCTQYFITVTAEGIDGKTSQPSVTAATTSSVVPGPPSNLTIEDMSPESLNISWLMPSYGSKCIKQYIIYWSDPANTTWENGTTTKLRYSIERLTPCTNYLVSIVVESTSGETSGLYNSSLSTASIAPGPVTNLKIDDVSTDALGISWSSPTYGDNCVKLYAIYWSARGTTTMSNATSNLYYTIVDLEPCAEYNVTVIAVGKNDETSEPLSLNKATTSVVPRPVSNLTIEDTSPDYLNISWLAPSYGSNCVKWYVISWSDTSTTIWTNDTTSELNYTIQDLNPCTQYVVSVVAEGQDGETSEVRNATENTASVVPEPVSGLKVENNTSLDSISISWMTPSYGGTCVNQYIVSWRDSSTTLWSNKTTSKLHHTIEDLQPCTEYEITVIAQVYNGNISQPSELKETTASVVPASISNLTVEDISSDSLSISWMEPSNGSTCVKWYTVSWSNSSTTIRNETISELYYTIQDLNPCTEYVITVIAKGNNGEESQPSISKETTASAVPGQVSVLSAENITSNMLNISWMVPSFGGNCVKSYYVSWREATSTEWTTKMTNELYYIIEDLIACTEYDVSVVAIGNNNDVSDPRDSKESTSPVAPDPVSDLTSGFLYPDEKDVLVILSWKVPHRLKDILVRFLISYEGYDPEVINSKVDKNEFFWNYTHWDIDSPCRYTLYNLHPDYQYSVSVSTVIKCGYNESALRYTDFRYPAGVPKANNGSLIKLKPDPFSTADPTKQAKLTLYSDFFGEENGRVKSYAIIVAQERYQENPQAQRINGSKPIMNNWHNATAGEVIWPYQATKENWNPFTDSSVRAVLRLDVEKTTFTLGTDECTNPGTYCNGELRPNTNYSVKIRAFTNGGYQDSQLFYFVTDSEVRVGMILGILFSIISLGAAGIAFFMYRNGLLNWPPPIFKKHSEVSVPPPSISIKKFPAHCTQMLQIPNKLSNEYQLLATLSADVYSSNTFLVAQNPENKKKNRYVNILPYDSTRVTLEAIDDDPFSDYINASFIKGYSNDIEYIASQGPKEETHVDFWRMVFQHNVHLIVMVTNLVENEKVKCYKYFPNLREAFEVRDMTIGCTSEISFPVYTTRTFLLNKGERRRLVTQLHFREWPDFGTPDSSNSMLQFVQTVRDHAARGVGLTVVHCSAGVGRTGTLIALDILLQHICEHKHLDVFGTVFRLRKQRINMVQTEGQYAYIYKCIKEALEDPAILNKSNSTTNSMEPIYENVGTSLKNLQYERLSQVRLKSSSSESECEL